jgi:hypothetical protein
MRPPRPLRALVLGAMLALPSYATHAFQLADGNDWKNSSQPERAAYLIGISNTISVGNAYDQRKVPGEDTTFMRQAARGLSETTVPEAVRRIDAWYAANPGRLDVPVLSVLWIDIVKPKLGQ